MTQRFFAVVMLAGALVLAACSSTDGGSVQSLRAAAGIETTAPAPTAQPTPLPSETPDLQPETIAAPATPQPVVVEVTREIVHDVPATVEVPVEVTREVVQQIIVTATPDIAGFQDSGVDESIQPCPVRYWKRGRCVATDAQIEAYANEVKP